MGFSNINLMKFKYRVSILNGNLASELRNRLSIGSDHCCSVVNALELKGLGLNFQCRA